MTTTSTPSARAEVPTDRPERWLKQLAGHLGRKAEVREQADGTLLVLGAGSCLMTAAPGALLLAAAADDEAGLARVMHVVGGHLERFAEKEGLTVPWERAA